MLDTRSTRRTKEVCAASAHTDSSAAHMTNDNYRGMDEKERSQQAGEEKKGEQKPDQKPEQNK